MSDTVIRIENLWKEYRIGANQGPYRTFRESLTEMVAAPVKRLRAVLSGRAAFQDQESFWALKDVSFEIKRGEVVGLIGRNGAGKSTLLKILSRITEPTRGQVQLKGRVGALLEVGTGFHPELTGRENIFLNGALLGMKRAEIKRKFDDIVEFSEVAKFLDTPVKFYSSGMYVRLAFAVAAHLDPEVLIIDEVLAVGDAQFQKKCLGKMSDVASQGRTVLFVSHNMGVIRRLCPHAVWLAGGEVTAAGDSATIVTNYLREVVPSGAGCERELPADESKPAQLRRIRLLGEEGEPTAAFHCDQPIVIELTMEYRQALRGLYGYLELRNNDGMTVLMSDSFDSPPNVLDGLNPGTHRILLTVPPRTIGPGDYHVYLSFASRSADRFLVDEPNEVAAFRLDDFTTQRGNARPGFLSSIVTWRRS